MSFYLRKSIKVGPLRFNLSKSGIGVSAGITGFRIGAGPRGNYVHMGRGGVYYRKTLSPSPNSRSQLQDSNNPTLIPDLSPLGRTVGPMVEIESESVTAMADSSSTELLQELDEKKKKVRVGPIIAVVALVAACSMFFAAVPPIIQVVIDICWIAAVYLAFQRDALAKTVVLFTISTLP